MDANDFSGAKLAVIVSGKVLAFLRDDKPGIPFPGMWDLPGGGREAGETPVDCAVRETWEEAGLRISPVTITWERVYANHVSGLPPTWFLVADPGWLALPPLRLGAEGQEVRWMAITEFLALDDAIPYLQARLREYQASRDVLAWRTRRLGRVG